MRRGFDALRDPLFNKGTAFTPQERHDLSLEGLLPPSIESIDQQLARCLAQFSNLPSPIAKYVFMMDLLDNNEVLFYRLVLSDSI
jgi:hypothetical protein